MDTEITSIKPNNESAPQGLGGRVVEAYKNLSERFKRKTPETTAKVCIHIVEKERNKRERGVELPQLEDMNQEFLGRAARVYGIEIEALTETHIQNLNPEEQAMFTGTWPEGEKVGELSPAHKIGLAFSSAVAVLGTVSPFLTDGPA